MIKDPSLALQWDLLVTRNLQQNENAELFESTLMQMRDWDFLLAVLYHEPQLLTKEHSTGHGSKGFA